VSSLGKTAFVLQIADQIAKNEHDVLFFALEMSADELIARSISRETFEWCGNERSPDGIALSTLDIFNGLKENNNEESKLAYEHAMNKYGEYSEHMFIFTTSQNKKRGIVTYDIKTTRGIILAIEEHIRVMQRTPIIIIDYLQLLDLPNKNTKYNKGLSDKQIVDQNIFALKKISSDFNTPVIAVSSLNRASYNSKDIDFSAFKESGSIEYSCDTLIGLQFQDKSDPNEAKQKEPRDIEAVILKQRNGPVGAKINFSFHAKYNCFEEVL
jgi:replicative DNA helicase